MKFTLLSDGVSDQALIPILVWLIRQAGVRSDLQTQWADLGRLRKKPDTLAEKIRVAIDLYPCELLFVHRDAERERLVNRTTEIGIAMDEVRDHGSAVPHVCVVPIRMQEAWLLFSAPAIRSAAGNPGGRVALDLPRLRDTEGIPDPKELLRNLIRVASELNARRLRRFPVSHACVMVAEYIDDFSPLRRLSAFAALEEEVRLTIETNHWA